VKSITNKIALMLIVALCISFVAMSTASYYTAQSKTIELATQAQRQILKDVKSTLDTFFDNNFQMIEKIAATMSKLDENRNGIDIALAQGKAMANKEVALVYARATMMELCLAQMVKIKLQRMTIIQEQGVGIK